MAWGTSNYPFDGHLPTVAMNSLKALILLAVENF